MKCLTSLNSQELVKDFVLNEDTWKEKLVSAVVWEEPAIVGGFGGVEPGEMDLEEGEFRPIVAPETDQMRSPAIVNQEARKEEEPLRNTGKAGGRHELHGEPIPAHVEANSLGSPRTPRNKIVGPFGVSDQVGPSTGQFSCVRSRKRPRIFRSPIHSQSPMISDSVEDGGIRMDIPSFPDLNNPAFSGDSLSLESDRSDGVFGAGSGTVIPKSQPAGVDEEVDKEVADTIEVGS
ncbi:hypothetical protein L1987_66293 [Smallanthus sonchifolius]|uniref:Uncharacterized protein n=1 Tax=Smallanthus sonchifolius TaxID=185202 RepID=A0ACB9BWP3_9ASTR|nr:hypothetical protein L1987_66293 [Smallanthus sonchifolius]